ncbi:MAG TPA: hypothetical protein VII92_02420 [Anaerolineae bacterium]
MKRPVARNLLGRWQFCNHPDHGADDRQSKRIIGYNIDTYAVDGGSCASVIAAVQFLNKNILKVVA